MTNHPQTRKAREIDAAILGQLAHRGFTAPELSVRLPYSQHGIRNALLRLLHARRVVCTLDSSVVGYPRRVWAVAAASAA